MRTRLTHSSWLRISVASTAALALSLVAFGGCDSGSQSANAEHGAESGTEPGAGGVEVPEGATHAVSTTVTREGDVVTLQASVVPGSGFHINLEFPWALQFAEDAVALAGERFTRDNAAVFTEETVQFAIPAGSLTDAEVAASLRFSVCNDTACHTPTEQLAWNIE